MENLITCGICFVKYDQRKRAPRQLPCKGQHVFCTRCVKEIAKKHARGVLEECPACREEIDRNLKDIPKSRITLELMDTLESEQRNKIIKQDVENEVEDLDELCLICCSRIDSSQSCSLIFGSIKIHTSCFKCGWCLKRLHEDSTYYHNEDLECGLICSLCKDGQDRKEKRSADKKSKRGDCSSGDEDTTSSYLNYLKSLQKEKQATIQTNGGSLKKEMSNTVKSMQSLRKTLMKSTGSLFKTTY